MAPTIVGTTLLETFELMGQTISDDAVRLLLARLAAYPEERVVKALERCQCECRRVYLADILERLKPKRILN